MTNGRTILTVALGALFAVAVVAYSFHHSFQSGATRAAIPAEASFTFVAKNLGELLASPVRAQLDNALGSDRWLNTLADGNGWTRLAVSSEIAVADLPFRGAGERKAWAAASWVGWRGPWLRWKLEAAAGDTLRLQGKYSIWPVWRLESKDLPSDMSLTFALTDQLFIACLSENPTDIHQLLDTYDKRAPTRSKGYQP